MCKREKAQQMMNEIDCALFDIHNKFGTIRDFGYSFLQNKITGEIERINLTIPACPDIDSSLPADFVKWRPAKIEKKLLPILRSLTI